MQRPNRYLFANKCLNTKSYRLRTCGVSYSRNEPRFDVYPITLHRHRKCRRQRNASFFSPLSKWRSPSTNSSVVSVERRPIIACRIGRNVSNETRSSARCSCTNFFTSEKGSTTLQSASIARFQGLVKRFNGCSSCNCLIAWLYSSCSMPHWPGELPQ